MTRSAPTGTVSSSPTRILVTVPATGEGISVSTLSVETSSNGSSTATWSPSALSQRVTVPSVTDSPRAGIVTVVPPAIGPPEADGIPAGTSAAGWDTASWTAGAAKTCSGAGSAAAALAEDGAPSPTMARSVPTGTVSSSATRISWSVPATGDGISVSTLSVDTSSNGSSTATESPTFFSQRVTVPSVTDSPRAGMVTRSDEMRSPRLRCDGQWPCFSDKGSAC